MTSSNHELRAKARATLGEGIFNNEWLYAMLISLCVAVINGALSVTGIGSFIISGIISCAMANYFIGRVRGEVSHDGFSALLRGAQKDIAGSMITGILHTVFILLWSLLFIVPGIVKGCSYALTFYIKNDRPELSATEAITESRRMMDGFKMKYFLLQLSFIGWLIVGILCLGIGTFWVQAYIEAANAHFYEEVKAAKAPFIEVLPPEVTSF